MNINQIIENLSDQQVADIISGNGFETKGNVSTVKNMGGGKYSYESYNIATEKLVYKEIKIFLKNFHIFVKYLKIGRKHDSIREV